MATTTRQTEAVEEQSRVPSLRYYTDTTEGSTFESAKLRRWTESFLDDADRILNPCAGTAKLDVDADVVRVDIDEDADADLHLDFRNLPQHVEAGSFDAIVYDPPYSYNQAVSKYGVDLEDDGFYFYSPDVLELFDELLAPGGVFIQFGYTTSGMPREFGYELLGIGLFNKLGSQNDYLGTAVRKPDESTNTPSSAVVTDTIQPNAGADNISNSNVSAGGNGGDPIEMHYRRCAETTPLDSALSETTNRWVRPTDRVLHIYYGSPTVEPDGKVTECAYRSIDLDEPTDDTDPDVLETPWNIGSRFATGVFDAVVLDIPYSAFQQNIRTPWKEASDSDSDRTHVATALKRSITDLVTGDGGRVIQIGRTATLMSGIDYDYRWYGAGVVEHPQEETDRIVVVDEKPHENLETVGLPDGHVDAYSTAHLRSGRNGATGTTSKHHRTDVGTAHTNHFCVHCGNGFYYPPALYVTCLECGARPENYCVDDEGNIIRGTVHDIRVEEAEQRHDGACNDKEPQYLSADEEHVDEVLQELSEESVGDEIHGLSEKRLRDRLEAHFCEQPRSTNLVERVLTRLKSSNEGEIAEGTVSTSPKETERTTLSDYC